MPRWLSFVAGLALMAAWWPGASGAATTPRWDVGAVLAIPVMLAGLFGAFQRASTTTALGGALLGWLAISTLWSTGPLDGADQVAKLLVILCAFYAGGLVEDLRPLVAGAAIGLIASSMVSVLQLAGFAPVESYGRIGGLFYNGDRMAEAAVLVLAAAIGLRLWWAIPGLLPALILPLTRTAWLAATAAIVLAVWRRGRTFERFVVVWTGGMVAAAGYMVADSVDWWSSSLAERLTIWRRTAEQLDVLGHGLGSFAAHPLVLGAGAGASVAEHPHSEWLWLAHEGGVVALALAAAFAAGLWRRADETGRYVLAALAVESLVSMPWHDPGTVLFACLVAGSACRGGADLRDPAVPGGVALHPGHAAASSR